MLENDDGRNGGGGGRGFCVRKKDNLHTGMIVFSCTREIQFWQLGKVLLPDISIFKLFFNLSIQ